MMQLRPRQVIKPLQSPTARHWLRWDLNPSLLDPTVCSFCRILLPPSGSSPADSGIFPLPHSFPTHISKCSHSVSGTIGNTVANNGQGVLTVCQHHRKTAALLSLAAPVYLHALPSRLASASHWWKCWVCRKATLFLLPAGRLRLMWLVPRARQDLVSSMFYLNPSCLPKLPASHLFPSGFDMVEAELQRRSRNRCCGMNWPHGHNRQPVSTVCQASQWWGQQTFWGSEFPLDYLWVHRVPSDSCR